MEQHVSSEPSGFSRSNFTLVSALQKTLDECSLSTEDAARLQLFAQKLSKAESRNEFIQKRIIADKAITVKLLDQTIEGLSQRSRELEEREDSLAATVKDLKIANLDMQHFMHVASHDLKTPLRSIGSFAGLIKRKYGDQLNEEVQEYFQYIVRSAKSMNRVIDDLVHFNRISNVDKMIQVDLNEIASEVVHNLFSDIEESRAVVKVEKLVSVMAPRSGISQALQNLVRNAIIYSHPDRVPEISIRCTKVDNRDVLVVADNGIGLDNAYQEKAFLPFKRLADLNVNGTGMGLAITRRIVMQMGGEIWYDGVVGKGTTFYIKF